MRASQDLSGFVAGGGNLATAIAAAEPVVGCEQPAPAKAAPPTGAVFVDGASTWEMTERGPVCLAPYVLHFVRDVRTPFGHTLEGEVRMEGAESVPFRLPAEILGDARALRKMLAGLLGARFRTPRGRLERIVDAWLEASTVQEVAFVHDFGFSDDGSAFVDATTTLPRGTTRFGPPPDSPASLLGLREGDAVGVMRELLEIWPRVVGNPTTVALLLGVAGWGIVAPVLEARDHGVAPLLAVLNGPTGAGKSTHAAVVQCFFGDFASTKAALPFGSTPLSIEQESHLFRGAVMVVGDVKLSGLAEGGLAKVLAMVQRAGDRAGRRRLDSSGNAQAARPSRATWLFEGEDVPVTEGSALARLLILNLPASPRVPELVRKLEALLPRLPQVSRALVRHLLATQPWGTLPERYHAHANRLAMESVGAQNVVRVAKSIAAIAIGVEVWDAWLTSVGLTAPASVAELLQAMVGPSTAQLGDLAQATPGERFLELLRQLLASGGARLGEPERGGEMVGHWSSDGSIAYLLPDPVLGRIRRQFPDAAGGLAPAASIAADLMRMGAIAEHDANRRTKKVRVGGNSVSTWAIRAELLAG